MWAGLTFVLLTGLSPTAWSNASLQVDKTIVQGAGPFNFGSDITFEITITNVGTISLRNVLVTDPAAPDCGGYITSKGFAQNALLPGESFTYTCLSLNLQQEFDNRAMVTGEFKQHGMCLPRTTSKRSRVVRVDVENVPRVDIRKQTEGPDSRTVISGSDVDFEIVVTNTGDLDLSGVTVIDPQVGNCEQVIGDLAAGESVSYVCTAPAVTSDFTNLANTVGFATLVGQFPRECAVVDADPSTVVARAAECAVSITKTTDPDDFVLDPPPSCFSISGRPTSLTFKFTGGGCAASSNDQGDKANCGGSIDPAAAVDVVAGKDDFSNFYMVVGSPTLPGDNVTISGAFEASSAIELTNAGGVELNTLHTSCSQPLAVGDVFGSLTMIAINGVFAGTEVLYGYEVMNIGDMAEVTLFDDKLGPIPEPGLNVILMDSGQSESFIVATDILETTTNIVTASAVLIDHPSISCMAQASVTVTAEPAPASCANGDPTALVFEYTGESCDASANDQGSGATCSGDPAGASPVQVVMTKDADLISVTPANESLALGGLVTIARTDLNKIGRDTQFDLVQGGGVLQSLKIHTSCSKPLNIGDQFGSLILREFIPE